MLAWQSRLCAIQERKVIQHHFHGDCVMRIHTQNSPINLSSQLSFSPIINNVNGFLSDDPAELRGFALQLLADRELAVRLGAGARETVRRQFSPERFAENFLASLSAAAEKWKRRPQS